MTKPTELRPQDITSKTVQRSTLILSIALTFFATLAATTIANWFVYGSIHQDARKDVVSDMQMVSKDK